MNKYILLFTMQAAAIGCIAITSAQPAFDSKFSPRERLMGNFESKAPAVGAPVPAINAYDSEGTSFNLLERLKGRHTVLVFGCLT